MSGNEVPDYGIAGFAEYEEPKSGRKNLGKRILGVLHRLEGDADADLSEPAPETKPMATAEPVQPPGVLPEDPQIDMHPPGFGDIPGMESPQDLIPGVPPDPFNEPMP